MDFEKYRLDPWSSEGKKFRPMINLINQKLKSFNRCINTMVIMTDSIDQYYQYRSINPLPIVFTYVGIHIRTSTGIGISSIGIGIGFHICICTVYVYICLCVYVFIISSEF